MILHGMLVSDTDRKVFGQCLSPDLCKEITFPTLQSSGTQPVSRDCSNSLVRIIELYILVLNKNLEFMLSIPEDDDILRFSIILVIPTVSIKIGSILGNSKDE